MELWHFLDQGVRDGVSDRITLDILRIELTKDLELLLDQSGSLYLLLLSGGEHVLSLRPFPFLGLQGCLAEGGGRHGLSFGVEDHLLGPELGHLLSLLLHLLPSDLLLLHLLHFDLELALLFLLAALPLLLLTLLLGIFPLLPILLLLELSLAGLLPLLLLEVADEALSGDGLALEALPDTIRHTLQVSTEEMVRLLAAATIDEVTRILAFEAVVRVLVFKIN